MSAERKAVTIILVFILAISAIITTILAVKLDNVNGIDTPSAIPLETLENVFIDIDGDGDLDYVRSVQFVRQISAEKVQENTGNPSPVQENPIPAPEPNDLGQ